MAALHEGQRISNYLLETPLGTGTFGEVWRARHHVLSDVVAIKVPTEALYVRHLQREGVAVHGLRHPNVVRVLDLDPYAEPPYLVMEMVDGPSLRQAVDRYGATFPIAAAVQIMRGVLRALEASHAAGLLHRDIKPANVLLQCPLGDMAGIHELAVKVTDFGLGTVGGLTTRSMMQSGSLSAGDGGKIAGTLAYMSPEQREGDELDGRSDLYSCGIVLFEMLTGERPQGNEVPGTLRRDVPPQLDTVFRKCYARKDRRFRSAEEMLSALNGAVPPPVQAPPPIPHRLSAKGGIRCSECGFQSESGDSYCIMCGRQLVETVPRCRSCGAFVKECDRYCIRCGKSLTVLI